MMMCSDDNKNENTYTQPMVRSQKNNKGKVSTKKKKGSLHKKEIDGVDEKLDTVINQWMDQALAVQTALEVLTNICTCE